MLQINCQCHLFLSIIETMACLYFFFKTAVILQHFGKEIIAKELQLNEDHEDVHRVYLAIYKSFVEVRVLTRNQL
jgi:hypothetical protein